MSAVLLSGCDQLRRDEFQFVTTPSGDCYVFHPKSGRLARVTEDGIRTLQEATPVLRRGAFYRLEDGSGDTPFVKYVGAGKFEPSKFAMKQVSADEILKKYGIEPGEGKK